MGPQPDRLEDQVAPVQHEDLNVDHRQVRLADQQVQVQAVVHREQAQLEVQVVDLQAPDPPEALPEVLLAVQAQALPVALTQEVRQEEVLLHAALLKERRS